MICTHCGTVCDKTVIQSGDHVFCCEGCRTVYGILSEHNLCDYYEISPDAVITSVNKKDIEYTQEELELMESDFSLYKDESVTVVLFHIPEMHCSSCIWLLERLHTLDAGITFSRADFLKKQLKVTYTTGATTFGKIVYMLASIGYAPALTPESENLGEKKLSRSILIKLGVAGFCAGNIMMFSFPQYLGLDAQQEQAFGRMFDGLNVVLSLPLVLYSAAEYFQAFFRWISGKGISVKVPLALGIGALWLRSIYEVSSATGPGYFDSLAGLIFFLLIGTWLQNRTFDSLRFGEKAIRFFPLVARLVKNGVISPKKVNELEPGDRITVAFGEIIPADGILMGADAHVNYSFATGESEPLHKVAGEILYGGGRNAGTRFEMEIIRKFDSGKLSEIWKSNRADSKAKVRVLKYEEAISRYFIAGTIALSLLALIIWLPVNAKTAWFAFTAVLMVACPCALALAPPFAFNMVSNAMAKMGLFVRTPGVVGKIGETQSIVFDKTGTLTSAESVVAVIPDSYTKAEKQYLKSIASQSEHPMSRAVVSALSDIDTVEVSQFKEFVSKGSFCESDGIILKLGNAAWTGANFGPSAGRQLFFCMDNHVLEPIAISGSYHSNLRETLTNVKKENIEVYLASGDTDHEKSNLISSLPDIFEDMRFEQSPSDKAEFIKNLQKGGSVIMAGDGLNDAAALNTGDVGMVVTDNTNNFTPEADAILLRKDFGKLPLFIQLGKKANRIVTETFVVSLIYNATALALAIMGKMSPLTAAILMPASSIALMLYAYLRTKTMLNTKLKGENI